MAQEHHTPPPGAPPATIVDLEKGEPTYCPYCDTQLGYFVLYEGTPRIKGVDGYVMLCTACGRIFVVNDQGKEARRITTHELAALVEDPFWPQMSHLQACLLNEISNNRMKRAAEGNN